MSLHKQFGPIASFWFGPTYVVSIANAEMFKQHHNVFDRPRKYCTKFAKVTTNFFELVIIGFTSSDLV